MQVKFDVLEVEKSVSFLLILQAFQMKEDRGNFLLPLREIGDNFLESIGLHSENVSTGDIENG